MSKPKPIPKSDWKYVPVDPEEGFSAEHNRRVVDRSIKKYEAMRAKKQKEFDGKARERASALASYLKSLDRGNTSNVEKYFGRNYLAHLRGQEIMDYAKKKQAEEEAKAKKT